jgi:lipopolysaccharide export system protein LptC
MNARLYDRLAAALSLALVIALALFTFYLAKIAQREDSRRASNAHASTQPDFFVNQLALLTMDDAGHPSLRVEAHRLQHNPEDNSALLESPVLVSLDPTHPRLTVTASHGQISADGSEAKLSGDVVVTRAATERGAPLMINTDAATVYPDRYVVQTDRAVTVVEGTNRLSGVGMALDYRQRQLRVDSQVRSVWMPPSAGRPARTPAAPPTLASPQQPVRPSHSELRPTE